MFLQFARVHVLVEAVAASVPVADFAAYGGGVGASHDCFDVIEVQVEFCESFLLLGRALHVAHAASAGRLDVDEGREVDSLVQGQFLVGALPAASRASFWKEMRG